MLCNVKIQRLCDDGEATIGVISVNDTFLCFSLEDQEQHGAKVYGETRIPSGVYELEPIYNSPMAQRYREKFGHEFLIGIKDVPGFTNIRVHIFNNDDQSEGCIGVGFGCLTGGRATIQKSTNAYCELFNKISHEIEKRNAVITIID